MAQRETSPAPEGEGPVDHALTGPTNTPNTTVPMSVAVAPRMSSLHWEQRRFASEQFISWLDLDNPADRKDCGGYVLGTLVETTVRHRGAAVDCTALHRNNNAVESRSALALDADKAAKSFVPDVSMALGCGLIVYSTWSHTPAAPRYRAVAQLSRDVSPSDFSLITNAVMEDVGRDQFDPGSVEPSRLMHRPSSQNGSYQRHVIEGPPLDADLWLARAKELGLDVVPPVAVRAPVTPSRAVPEDVVREQVSFALRGLDAIAALPEGARHPWPGEGDGLGWDLGPLLMAERLVQAANSGSSYTLEQAYADFLEHAPPSEGTYDRDHKWDSAVTHAGDGGVPYEFADEVFEPVTSEADQAVRERFPAVDWRALWDDTDEEEWIHDPLLPAGRSVSIYSAPKVGKSLLMLEMAVAVSRGDGFLGYTPDRGYRVMYVDFENNLKGDVRTRLQAMGHGPEHLGHLDYLSFPPLSGLDTERGAAELLAAVKAYGSEVVIVDTVSRAVAGEENSNDTWLALYRHTGVGLKRAGVAVIRLDHSGKDETKGTRGGSAKSGDVDAIWRLSRITDDLFRLECSESRMQIDTKSMLLTRHAEPLRHSAEVTAPTERADPSLALMALIATALEEHGAMSGRRIRAAVPGRAGTILQALDRMILEGYVSDNTPHQLLKPYVDGSDFQ